MIIIRLMGGLGNQLQQYALYQKFIALGKEVYLDTSWFDENLQTQMNAPRSLELNLFEKADYQIADDEIKKRLLGAEKGLAGIFNKLARKLKLRDDYRFFESDMYHPQIFEMQNAYLEGYWAANKYYEDVMPVIREKLLFTQIDSANCEMAAGIEAESEYNTCSVHIRRGDYLDANNAAMFGNIATPEYYDRAFEYILEKYPETRFYIFSDDMEYVKNKYGNMKNCFFVDINHGEKSRFDIYLMSKCRTHICANSTFSFWGARLDQGDGIRIRPSIHKNSQVFIPEQMHDLWKDWVLIDPQGQVR